MTEKKEKPPVVAVLGHVDHGKSSLLEAVKDIKITEKEAGGITQHIGAYIIEHKKKKITFIDTPGHEAFSAVRKRGAGVADIGVLVVAGDESIKEQTKEVIKNLKESQMPFVVAINKIDKEGVDIDKVKQDLSKEGVFVESYGGDIPCVNISAKKKKGLEELLEIITLLAEMEDLKIREDCLAGGVIIEVQRDSRRGVTPTFLIKKGVLRRGDAVGTSCAYGKIKTMENFLKEDIEEAGPSVPVQVTGIKGNPVAGEEFFVFETLEDAKKFSLIENEKSREEAFLCKGKTLNIIVKADTTGSLEAIEDSIKKIPQTEVKIRMVKMDIGGITENDIECCRAMDIKIFAFRVDPDKGTEKMAIREKIEIKKFDIIYELIKSIREEAEELLEEETIKEEVGRVAILAVFKNQKNRQILGGKVEKGIVVKGAKCEILRKGEVLGEGKLVNIKKEEKDMEKITEKEEMGMLLESNTKAEEGDRIVIYKEEKRKKKL